MANLRIAELDFDTIKYNLKEFLKNYTAADGAPYFTDFDFEGSGLSVLLDLLSYNTHYNAYLASMVINEMFLDSAVKRDSAVSLAKNLGYTPVSARGAIAKLSFEVISPTNNPTFLTLEKYTPFSTQVNDTVLTFVNLKNVTIQPNVGRYLFNSVEVVEGIPLQYTYSVDVPGPAEKYVIPNDNIDTTTLEVIVQNSLTDTTQILYAVAEDTLNISGESTVYYLEETPGGKFQIYFGDGILGKKLTRNNLVIINYIITSGSIGNVSGSIRQNFSCEALVGGGSITGTITADVNSQGGLEKENIDSIKFRAPRLSSSQNRAVTAADYKALIERNFPLVESISVWGGEENDPPKYGRVIIGLKPYVGYEVTDQVKNNISKLVLQNKQMLGIATEFIEPDYFYVNLSIKIKYNTAKGTLSSTTIKNLVINEVQKYFSTYLQKFEQSFIFSKLSKNIDSLDDYIIGNLMTLKLQRRITPELNSIRNNYINTNSIRFKNAIKPGTLDSTEFLVSYNGAVLNAKLKDVPNDSFPNNNGTGKIYVINNDNNEVLYTNYGDINYATGIVTIYSLMILGYLSDIIDVRISVEIQDEYLDINVSKNEILVLDDSTLNPEYNRMAGLSVNIISV
jgi:hypothetical protein